MEEKQVYSERFVAFIDILGFKNHIDESDNDSDKAASILSVLKKIQLLVAGVQRLNETLLDDGERMTAFSDSIIISQPVTDSGSLFCFLLNIARTQLELLVHGYVVRGGVSVGRMYQNESIVFGPAFIDAYLLEECRAQVPWVVLRKSTLDYAFRLPLTNPLEYEVKAFEDLLLHDESDDEILYIDFLRQDQELDYSDCYVICMQSIRNVIIENLSKFGEDPKVKPKYEWLRDYYNEVYPEYKEFLFQHGIDPISDDVVRA